MDSYDDANLLWERIQREILSSHVRAENNLRWVYGNHTVAQKQVWTAEAQRVATISTAQTLDNVAKMDEIATEFSIARAKTGDTRATSITTASNKAAEAIEGTHTAAEHAAKAIRGALVAAAQAELRVQMAESTEETETGTETITIPQFEDIKTTLTTRATILSPAEGGVETAMSFAAKAVRNIYRNAFNYATLQNTNNGNAPTTPAALDQSAVSGSVTTPTRSDEDIASITNTANVYKARAVDYVGQYAAELTHAAIKGTVVLNKTFIYLPFVLYIF